MTVTTPASPASHDPHRTVSLAVQGFVPAFLRDALEEIAARENLVPVDVVSLLIAERARTYGIKVPEVRAETLLRIAREMRERQAQREKLA